MAKEPEAKEQILEMAVKRLKELQELNEEVEEKLVVLEPLPVSGISSADEEENFNKMVIVDFF